MRKLILLSFIPLALYADVYEDDDDDAEVEYWTSDEEEEDEQTYELPARRPRAANKPVVENQPPKKTQPSPRIAQNKVPPAPQKATTFGIMGEYLFWSASEDGLEFAIDGINAVTVPLSPTGRVTSTKAGKAHNVPQEWNSGLRLGIDLAPSSKTWDIDAEWTWYAVNSRRGLTSRDSDPHYNVDAMQPVWGFPQYSTSFIEEASARWKLQYNTVDLSLRRIIRFSKDFTLSPFIGLRGAWIDQIFNVHYTSLIPSTTYPDKQTIHNKNDFRGLGFRTGFDTAFYLSPHFSIFADAGLSLLLGKFHVKQKISSTIVTTGVEFSPVNTRETFTSLKAQFETMLGLRWETSFSDERFHFEMHAGYEFLVWLEQNQMFRFVSGLTSVDGNFTYGTPGEFVRVGGDLFLQGLTAGASFRF